MDTSFRPTRTHAWTGTTTSGIADESRGQRSTVNARSLAADRHPPTLAIDWFYEISTR